MKSHETDKHWQPPKLDQPWFEPMTDAEAAELRGGQWGAGTCVGIGYACNAKGSLRPGLCAIIGVFK